MDVDKNFFITTNKEKIDDKKDYFESALKYKNNSIDDSVILELLRLSPTSNKECRILLGTMDGLPIVEIYNRILGIKLSNKDLIYFLNIMNEYLMDIDLEKFVNLKLGSIDKYTNQLMIVYFEFAGKYFADKRMIYSQKIEIFVRYLYVFENDISRDLRLYKTFKKVLDSDFLDLFVFNRCYRQFYFLKEFLVDFCTRLSDNIVKIGYECPHLRRLICSLYPNSWTFCWLEQTKFSDMFYSFDFVYFMQNLAEEKFDTVKNLQYQLESELGIRESECRCSKFPDMCLLHPSQKFYDSVHKIFAIITNAKRKKEEFRNSILEFNKTGKNLPSDLKAVRLCHLVDLSVLGEFLCKEKNKSILENWAETFTFSQCDLLESLREFLNSFQLGGESQVIDRVVSVFAQEFAKQNLNDNDVFEVYYKLSYSFIFLNTVLHNPGIEKKITSEEYFKKAENEVIGKETLKKYYDSIKENELRKPQFWEDGFDKYQLYKSIFKNVNEERKDFYSVVAAYKYLFSKHYNTFIISEAEYFFQICNIFDSKSTYEKYISFCKNHLSKYIIAYKYFIGRYIIAEEDAKNIQGSLEKIEKTKGNIIKSVFRNKQVLSTFNNVYNQFILIEFVDSNTFIENIRLLYSVSTNFTRTIYNSIVVNNADLITPGNVDVISNLVDFETLFHLINKLDFVLDTLSLENQLKYFEIALTTCFTEDLYKKYIETGMYIKGRLQLYCNISRKRKEDDYDLIIVTKWNEGETQGISTQLSNISLSTVHKNNSNIHSLEHSKDNSEHSPLPLVSFLEVFPEELKDSENVIAFFSTQNSSIINVKLAKQIHKNGCPLEIDEFLSFDKIAYMLLKLQTRYSDKLFNYVIVILNYLSDSLPLYIQIMHYCRENAFILNGESITLEIDVFNRTFIKILKVRIKKMSVLCCEKMKEGKEDINRYLLELYKSGYLEKNDIPNLKEEESEVLEL